MAFSLNDAIKNVMQNVQNASQQATSNVVNNQVKNGGFSSKPSFGREEKITSIDFQTDPVERMNKAIRSNLPNSDSRTYLDNDEYFNETTDKLFQPYEKQIGSGDVQNVPSIADYNGFNFNDFPAAMYQNDTNSNYEGMQGVANDMYGTDARNNAQQAQDQEDAERAAWVQYLANNNLKKEDGSVYTGTGDFQLNGTYDQWRDAMLSDELSPYYEDVFKDYGGSKDTFNFDDYWNEYKPRDVIDVIGNNDLAQRYFGTSAGNIDDIATYLAYNDLYDSGIQNLYNGDSDEFYKTAAAMNSYKIGDMILQNMLANGVSSDDFMKEFSVNELNQLFRKDPSMFTTDPNDSEGSLAEWDKRGNEEHPTDFNIMAYQNYNGAPYAGLADTLTALAGDKLYHKTRPVSQEGQE